jgi:hypothetical protein
MHVTTAPLFFPHLFFEAGPLQVVGRLLEFCTREGRYAFRDIYIGSVGLVKRIIEPGNRHVIGHCTSVLKMAYHSDGRVSNNFICDMIGLMSHSALVDDEEVWALTLCIHSAFTANISPSIHQGDLHTPQPKPPNPQTTHPSLSQSPSPYFSMHESACTSTSFITDLAFCSPLPCPLPGRGSADGARSPSGRRRLRR